jgi:hypothetical protein
MAANATIEYAMLSLRNSCTATEERCFIRCPCRDTSRPVIQCPEVIQNHDNEHVRGIGQGEARHTKYKRLKLGGGQAYDRSID